jgi:putative FmdB family regulatory protein
VPIYEYRRPDGTTFEVVQAFSDDALTVDPDTGVPVERVLHAPAVHFKGTGFYNTDYGTRKRNRETLAAAEGSSSEKDSSADSKAADSSSSDGSAGATDASSASPESKQAPRTAKESGGGQSKKRAPTKRANAARKR